MGDFLITFLPILGFMFVPVWIPIVSALVGAVLDRIVIPKTSPARQAVEAAKARSAHRLAPPTGAPV